MSVYKDYYRTEAEKQKRQFKKPKRIKRFCWKLETHVEFISAKCSQDACPHKHTTGCLEDARLVE